MRIRDSLPNILDHLRKLDSHAEKMLKSLEELSSEEQLKFVMEVVTNLTVAMRRKATGEDLLEGGFAFRETDTHSFRASLTQTLTDVSAFTDDHLVKLFKGATTHQQQFYDNVERNLALKHIGTRSTLAFTFSASSLVTNLCACLLSSDRSNEGGRASGNQYG